MENKQYVRDDYLSDVIYYLTSFEEREWVDRAACKGMDPNIFFPERGDTATYRKAIEVCSGCPVRAECREYGDKEATGIWGGASTKRRKVERSESLRS